jgi:hypothetical protein
MVPLVQRLADLRGSAFGLLAAVQSLGNVVASAVAGVLWTAISAWAGLSFAAALMGASLVVLALGARPRAGALDVVTTLLTNRAIRAPGMSRRRPFVRRDRGVPKRWADVPLVLASIRAGTRWRRGCVALVGRAVDRVAERLEGGGRGLLVCGSQTVGEFGAMGAVDRVGAGAGLGEVGRVCAGGLEPLRAGRRPAGSARRGQGHSAPSCSHRSGSSHAWRSGCG